MSVRAFRIRAAASVLAGMSVLLLAGCDDGGGDPAAQIGPQPKLPEIQQYLFPPMNVAKIVGWKGDEAPTVAQGLKIKALAKGLQHPRSIYVLPNGSRLGPWKVMCPYGWTDWMTARSNWSVRARTTRSGLAASSTSLPSSRDSGRVAEPVRLDHTGVNGSASPLACAMSCREHGASPTSASEWTVA